VPKTASAAVLIPDRYIVRMCNAAIEAVAPMRRTMRLASGAYASEAFSLKRLRSPRMPLAIWRQ